MQAPSYRDKWPIYAKQWDGMKITRPTVVAATASRIVQHKDRYQAVEAKTGVPWWWIGPTHIREANGSWMASLAQGDRWDRRSIHVPAGRGPFPSWEAAAIDALRLDGATDVIDWRLEKALYYWEKFNGWGYHAHGIPSPYVWGATSVQRPGKYIKDGVWSSTTMDQQVGCAAMLRCIMELDSTVKPERET